MAESYSTLESRSSQDNFYHTRKLTVHESVVVTPTDAEGDGDPPNALTIAPTILLRGKWLKVMGFAKGQKATLHIEPGILQITADFPGEWDGERDNDG